MVYLAHTSRSQSSLRKVRVGAEAEGMEERCLLPCSACLLRQAKGLPRGGTLCLLGEVLCQSKLENALQTCLQDNPMVAFSQLRFLFSGDISLSQVNRKKAVQDRCLGWWSNQKTVLQGILLLSVVFVVLFSFVLHSAWERALGFTRMSKLSTTVLKLTPFGLT